MVGYRTGCWVAGLVAVGLASAGPVLAAENGETKKQTEKEPAAAKSFYDFTVKDIDGKEVELSQYKGDVCLVVNVASRCGLTPQYADLEAMYEKYKDKGFRILAFPANNFHQQEPGSNAEIKKFCSTKYKVTFDLFSKISVKGDDQAPLYAFLTGYPNKEIAGPVLWNFQKYLIARDGTVLAKFDPKIPPTDPKLVKATEDALSAPAENPDASAHWTRRTKHSKKSKGNEGGEK
jgi:glutathione peroxidase